MYLCIPPLTKSPITPQPLLSEKFEIGFKTKTVIITLIALSCIALIVGTLTLLSLQTTMAPYLFQGLNTVGFLGSVIFISTGIVCGLFTVFFAYLVTKKTSETVKNSRATLSNALDFPPSESADSIQKTTACAEPSLITPLPECPSSRNVKKAAKYERLNKLHLQPAALENNFEIPNPKLLARELNLIFSKPEEEAHRYSVISQSSNVVFCLNNYPDYIFKYKMGLNLHESQQYVTKYLKLTRKAQKICEENRAELSALLIPPATAIKLNDRWVIVQKRVNIKGGYEYQKGLYRSYFDNPDLKEYTLNILKQIGLFILIMKMKDVKYDNIPLTEEGYVALPDLDEDAASPMDGFYTSCAIDARGDGLFHIAPHSYIDEIAAYLESKSDKFQKSLFIEKSEEVKRYSVSTEKMRREYKQYLSHNNIYSPSQTIESKKILESSALAGQQKIYNLQIEIVKYLNDCLANDGDNPDIECGRQKSIHLETFYESFTQDFQDIDEFKIQVEKVLKYLKDEKLIFDFEMTVNKDFYMILC